MEETETFVAVKNNDSNNNRGTGVCLQSSPSFTFSKEMGDSIQGQITTPNESYRIPQKQEHIGSSALPEAAHSSCSGSSGNITGFTVAAGDITQNNCQSSGSSGWPCSSGISTTTKSTLNPDAKEFRLSSGNENNPFSLSLDTMLRPSFSYGGNLSSPSSVSLFAVPSTSTPMPWQSGSGVTAEPIFPIPKVDATKWPRVLAHSRHAFLRDFPSSASPLTPRSIVRKVTEEFTGECQRNGYHMVAVFNLEPRTTQEELLAIFFPMCAKKAELLPPDYSPWPNRRAGVVFFPSEAFAVMAVEKLNNFVPNRQHQPLTVRYCSFDALKSSTRETAVSSVTYSQPQLPIHLTTETALSRLTLPWRLPSSPQLDRIHEDMWRFVCDVMSSFPDTTKHVVAVHGLDPENAQNVLTLNFINRGADRFDLWPVKGSSFVSAPMPCISVSAVVWFKLEVTARELVTWFQQKTPEGQTQPIDVLYLNNMTFARKEFLTEGGQLYNSAMEAGNEGQSIDNSEISYMTLIDKIDAYFLSEYDDPKLYLVGIHNLSVNTDKKALFSLLSPHGALDAEMYSSIVNLAGGLRGSGVAFFDNEVSARKAADKLNSFVPFKQPYPVVARYLVKPDVSYGMNSLKASSAMTADTMMCMSGGVKLNALVLTVKEKLFDSVVDAEQLTEKIMQVITNPDTTVEVIEQLALVIVDTLTVMKHHAGIVSTPLVNSLMSLHEKLNIPRNSPKLSTSNREACDPILARNINYMQKIAQAVINLLIDASKPHESRKVAAVLSGYMFQFCYIEKSPYELAVSLIKRNEKSINLAREYMMSPQMNLKPTSFAEYDDDEHKPWMTLMECLELLTSLWRQNNRSRAKKDPFRGEYERRANEFAQGNIKRTGGGCSLNTSTRPTPRRVVVKVTPGTGSSGETGSPGLTQASPTTTRVNIRSTGETHGMSCNISLESSPTYDMGLTTRYTGDISSLISAPANGNTFISTSQVSIQQQQQQQMSQKSQRSDTPAQCSVMEFTPAAESMKQTFGVRAGVIPMPLVYTHSELMERTVYITKLPSTMRRAQFRRLLLYFGEFNKVRLCRDDNQFQLRCDTTASVPFGELSTGLWFSFVEFAEQSGAKAMIEYFRNIVTNPNPFSFLLVSSMAWPEASHFTPENIRALLSARTSPARKPIHDQLPLDAVLSSSPHLPRHVLRHRPCLFGVEEGEKAFDAGMDLTSPPLFSPNINVTMGGSGGSGTCGGKMVVPLVDTTQEQHMHNLTPTSIQMDGFQSEAVEDEMELNTIMNMVVPTETTNMWVPETEGVLNKNDHVFNPVQISWLNDIPQVTQRTDLLTDMMFTEEDTASNEVTVSVERTSELDNKSMWLSSTPLCSNQFFDSKGYFNDDEG